MSIKLIQKEALKKLQKEMAKQAFKSTFTASTDSYSLEDNIEAISDAFANAMGDNSDKLFDIFDKLIDAKLSTATIIPVLTSSAGGGPVVGKITISGT